jgi:hypothetical protein
MSYIQLNFFRIHSLALILICYLEFFSKWIISKIYLELYELEILSQSLVTCVHYNVSQIYDLKILSQSTSQQYNLTLKNN